MQRTGQSHSQVVFCCFSSMASLMQGSQVHTPADEFIPSLLLISSQPISGEIRIHSRPSYAEIFRSLGRELRSDLRDAILPTVNLASRSMSSIRIMASFQFMLEIFER